MNTYQYLTNAEICQWIDNEESLHAWHKSSGLDKKMFVRLNHQELEAYINSVLSRKANLG